MSDVPISTEPMLTSSQSWLAFSCPSSSLLSPPLLAPSLIQYFSTALPVAGAGQEFICYLDRQTGLKILVT